MRFGLRSGPRSSTFTHPLQQIGSQRRPFGRKAVNRIGAAPRARASPLRSRTTTEALARRRDGPPLRDTGGIVMRTARARLAFVPRSVRQRPSTHARTVAARAGTPRGRTTA